MSKPKRKTKLIDRGFQYKMISKFVLLNSLILAAFGAVIYVFFKSEVSANLASAHVNYKSISQMLFPIVLTLSLLTIIITSLLLAIMVLYSSHKISGPVYRFNTALKEMAQKNLKPVTAIREGDQLQEVADSLQQLIQTLTSDLTTIRDKVSALEKEAGGKLKAELEAVLNVLSGYNF